MTDEWRRLRLAGLSLAAVVFAAPLVAAAVRTGDTTVLHQSPGVLVAAGLVFSGVVSSRGRRHLGWDVPPWTPGGAWVVAGLSLAVSSGRLSLALVVTTLGVVAAVGSSLRHRHDS